MEHSSSSSGIYFQGVGQSQVAGNVLFSSRFGNSSKLIPGNACSNGDLASGDVSNTVWNSVASSTPSIGASSLVTDANSGLSGGPQLQRNSSFNTESHMRLPTSPLSFSSNNISISGSSVMDGSSIVQQSFNQDPCSQQTQRSQQRHGPSSATSLPTSRMEQVQLLGDPRAPSSYIQDSSNMYQLQKKPRLDIKQDYIQQQVLQQLLQREDPMNLPNPNPHMQTLIKQQRFRQQQQQLLQSMPPMQRVQLLQQQQQQQQEQQQQFQLRQQLQQQCMQPASTMNRPYDGGVCSRRLMQYLYHQRQRPSDNTIAYWKKFVAEYYSQRAKKRWCLSLYDNVVHHSLGVFPQAAVDAWKCDICGTKSGRGFEATFEVLPRLNEIKFGSGVIDELLFLDLPRECRFPSGMLMLEYAKAVQESVYEQLRVVREGQLRIIFTSDLKILSWEFCARHHEELLPRRLVVPQVNQLLQVAQKCQSTISENGPDGVSQQDLQANSAMIMTAERQLARNLDLQSLNDLGFSKRYVRCLQIAEVVNSMKDLMEFCRDQKAGPIEGLKTFPRHTSVLKIQMQKMKETEQINKLMALQAGLNSQMNNNQRMVGGGALIGSAQAALAVTNYQNLLMRQNSISSTQNSLQHDAFSFNNSKQAPTSTPPGSTCILPGSMQNLPIIGFSSSHVSHQQNLHHLLSGNSVQQQNQSVPSQGSQALQQQMIQKLLQDMSTNKSGKGIPRQFHSMQSAGGNVHGDGLEFRNSPSPANNPAANGRGNAVGPPTSRSNSFITASTSESAATASSGFGNKESDFWQNLHLPEDMVRDHEFTENGFFNSDLDDNMDYSWKV